MKTALIEAVTPVDGREKVERRQETSPYLQELEIFGIRKGSI
jgi:hypothetical protein